MDNGRHQPDREVFIARVITQVLFALRALHEHSDGCFVHADIKPENIFLQGEHRNPQALLGDFGGSVWVDSARPRMDWEPYGTEAYCGPEAFSAHRNPVQAPKVDIWSLGITLLYALTLRNPLIDWKAAGGRRTHRSLPDLTSWIASAPEAVQGLLKKMLDVNPETRVSAAEALRDPWILRYGDVIRAERAVVFRALSSNLAPSLTAARARRRFSGHLRESNGRSSSAPGAAWASASSSSSAAGAAGAAAAAAPPLQHVPTDTVSSEAASILSPEVIYHALAACREVSPSGQLTREEMERVFWRLNVRGMPFEALFVMFDTDVSGTVTVREFLDGLSKLLGPREIRVKAVFTVYDLDGNGTISTAEVEEILQSCYRGHAARDREMTTVVAEAMHRLDPEGRGEISYEAFVAGAESNEHLLDLLLRPSTLTQQFMTTNTTEWLTEPKGLLDRIDQATSSIVTTIITAARSLLTSLTGASGPTEHAPSAPRADHAAHPVATSSVTVPGLRAHRRGSILSHEERDAVMTRRPKHPLDEDDDNNDDDDDDDSTDDATAHRRTTRRSQSKRSR